MAAREPQRAVVTCRMARVACSNLASPTKPIHPIRPSRTGIQPTFLLPSIMRATAAPDHRQAVASADRRLPATSISMTCPWLVTIAATEQRPDASFAGDDYRQMLDG